MKEPACPRCGGPMPQPRSTGRPATWCSDRCKRAAYEERRAAANGAIAVKIVEKVVQPDANTLNECADRVMASPVACRRVLDHLAELAREGQLHDPKWNSTVRSLTELIVAVTPRR
jgi:endogenous inhibitor of DNA gyrase (YacG/DUF329 family)